MLSNWSHVSRADFEDERPHHYSAAVRRPRAHLQANKSDSDLGTPSPSKSPSRLSPALRSSPSTPGLRHSHSSSSLSMGSSTADAVLRLAPHVFKQSPSSFRSAVLSLMELYEDYAELKPHKVGEKMQQGGEMGRRRLDGSFHRDEAVLSESDEDSQSESDDDTESRSDSTKAIAETGQWCHCCLVGWSATFSLVWAAFQSGGVPSMLAYLNAHFKWGRFRTSQVCEAVLNAGHLDCGGIACIFINMAQAVKRHSESIEKSMPKRLAPSGPTFPFDIVGCQLIQSCTPEESRRWMKTVDRSRQDSCWLGPGDSCVIYHQCMGLIRHGDSQLWVWDAGTFILPNYQHSNNRATLAIRVQALAEVSPYIPQSRRASTDSNFPHNCQWGNYSLELDQWYSWLPANFELHSKDVINFNLAATGSSLSQKDEDESPYAKHFQNAMANAKMEPQQFSRNLFPTNSPSLSRNSTSNSSSPDGEFGNRFVALSRPVVVFVSGLTINDDNPSPGSGMGRALRCASLDASQMGMMVTLPEINSLRDPYAANAKIDQIRSPYYTHLIGVDYSLGSCGVECEAFNETMVIDAWTGSNTPNVHVADVINSLRQDLLCFWIPSSDCETALLAKGLAVVTDDPHLNESGPRDWLLPANRVLIPPQKALDAASKPCIGVANILGMHVPPALVIDRSKDATLSHHTLQVFCSMQRGPFWVKGDVFGAAMAPNYAAAWRIIGGMQAAVDQTVLIQVGVQGIGKGIAFAAVEGELTAAIMMTKSQSTPLLKGWSGVLEAVPPPLLERIILLCKELNWTGGGELEYVEGLDGRLYFIDFNCRFPAWIYASTLAHCNMPQALLQHALHNYSKQMLAKSPQSRTEEGSPTSSDKEMGTGLFHAVIPFPSFIRAQSQCSTMRVHYTRTIVEVLAKSQPSVVYAPGFDSGVIGRQVTTAHPARLVEMARALQNEEKKKKSKEEKLLAKVAPALLSSNLLELPKSGTRRDGSTSGNNSRRNSLNASAPAPLTLGPRRPSASTTAKSPTSAKETKSKKAGAGADKYLPLLSQSWFDSNLDANGLHELIEFIPQSSDMHLHNVENELIVAESNSAKRRSKSNQSASSALVESTTSKTQKIWLLPSLHADMPDLIDSIRTLLPKVGDISQLPTPCFLISTSLIERSVALFQTILSAGANAAGIPHAFIGVSVKTQPLRTVLQAALTAGASAECISLGEIRGALAAGYEPSRIMFNGPAKNVDCSPESTIGQRGQGLKPHQVALGSLSPQDVFGDRINPKLQTVNADSIHELRLIVDAVLDPTHYLKSHGVGLRLVPPLYDSRFGVAGANLITHVSAESRETEAAIAQAQRAKGESPIEVDAPASTLAWAAKEMKRLPADVELGIHYHFASSTLGFAQWLSQIHGLIAQAVLLQALLGDRPLRYFDLGGGFPAGIAHQPNMQRQMMDVIRYLKAQLPGVQTIYLEPGKSLSERAGAMLMTVQHTRELADNGGSDDLSRSIRKFNRAERVVKGQLLESSPLPASASASVHIDAVSNEGDHSPRGSRASKKKSIDRPAEAVVVDSCVCDLGSIPTHAHPLFYLQVSKIDELLNAKEGEKRPASDSTLAPWSLFEAGKSAVYGRICMEWDVLGYGVRLPDGGMQPGDKIVMANTGAYDMSMAYAFGRGNDPKMAQLPVQGDNNKAASTAVFYIK